MNLEKQYKQELEYAKEISPIDNAVLNDLSIDKINHYITLLHREIRSETLKPSLSKAKPYFKQSALYKR